MAQGFRARMNNFHSVLIEVLNTAHMDAKGFCYLLKISSIWVVFLILVKFRSFQHTKITHGDTTMEFSPFQDQGDIRLSIAG
jgi:hypothetical protein